MHIFTFNHATPVKAGCCNYPVTETYWMADDRDQAEQEIADHTPDTATPHGVCADCMMQVLTSGDYTINTGEA